MKHKHFKRSGLGWDEEVACAVKLGYAARSLASWWWMMRRWMGG